MVVCVLVVCGSCLIGWCVFVVPLIDSDSPPSRIPPLQRASVPEMRVARGTDSKPAYREHAEP